MTRKQTHNTNKASKPSILVSHSNKQYVHRLIQALVENNNRVTFCTPLWWQKTPYWIKLLPSFLRTKVAGEIRKKSFTFSAPVKAIMRPSLILKKEIADNLTNQNNKELNQLNLEIGLDEFTARQIKKERPGMVIGYEISSFSTFAEAKKQNCITILDLAQIHYKQIDKIAHNYSDMRYVINDSSIELIKNRKQSEYNLADYILTLSSFAYQSLVDEGISETKIFTVNLGFDVQLFTPKLQYDISGPLKLMICGTDMKRKGLRLLLQVLESLQNRSFQIALSVIGPIYEIKEIMNEFPELCAVRCIPFLTHEELVGEYQAADLFVFPSYLDSWAMTVLESMACGTPVIVSENTGSKDAVVQGGGIIIPVGDHKSLENSILAFYNDRPLLETMGKTARLIAEKYTWTAYNTQISEVIKQISDQH